LIYFVTTDQPYDMRGKNIPSFIRGLGAESWTFISRRFDNANCHWEVLLEMRKELDKHFRYALELQKNDSDAELPDGWDLYRSFDLDPSCFDTHRSQVFCMEERYHELTGADYQHSMIDYSCDLEATAGGVPFPIEYTFDPSCH
jgi:hypothetical protein